MNDKKFCFKCKLYHNDRLMTLIDGRWLCAWCQTLIIAKLMTKLKKGISN